MKISLNAIQYYKEKYGWPDILAAGSDEVVKKIGAQLGGVDEVIDLSAKYQGIIVAEVVECIKHPDADKLSLCKINDGGKAQNVERDENGLVQVVCGAPNVRAGLKVAWLPPGATVPETFDKDPFVLEARELRGKVSNGMLASARELALSDSHDGILELPADLPAGADFAEATGLNDIIIDIENKMFTHRPDLFGFLGVSRELAGIQKLSFKSPDWYAPNPEFPSLEAEELLLTVTNELPELVPRFTAITMSNVEVGPSPLWLQVFLAEMGQKSINNIVDYTNYFMLQTGQPLHAYDYDKVKSLSQNEARIVVRSPRPGEKIKLLNGKEIEPRAEAIMIATDDQLIGLGGVMGGSETEVDADTKSIILECASFNMYSVRRTSMAHGLFTDAATRFTKGQSPLQNLAVLAKVVDEIREYASGKVASNLIDDNHLGRDSLFEPVRLTAKFVNDRLGLQLSGDEIRDLLQNVEFSIDSNGDELTIKAPFWRTDIELPEDIFEEVGRLYGYDHLPLDLPKRSLKPASKDSLLSLKSQIRSSLARAGANEVLTYSFVHGDLLKKVGQDADKAYKIGNALSPDLQYYRLSLLPSLLDKVNMNIRAGYQQFALFELGKTHILGEEQDNLPREFDRLALVFASNQKQVDELGAPYYQARTYLTMLLKSLGLADKVRFEALNESNDTATPYYQTGRSATILIDDKIIGRIGEIKTSVRRALKLPNCSAGFELGLQPLLELASMSTYIALPRFPEVIQDITLQVPADLSYQVLSDNLWQKIQAIKPQNSYAKLGPIDIYQKNNDYKNVTLRLKIASYERTLNDAEVNKILDEASNQLDNSLSVKRI